MRLSSCLIEYMLQCEMKIRPITESVSYIEVGFFKT